MDTELRQAIEQAPTSALVMMAVFAGAGFILWFMGKRIARQSIAVSGLVLGAVTAFPISQMFGSGAHMTLAWVIAGAVIGCLLAWLLYRVWMGASMGAILAFAAPCIYIVVFGVADAPPKSDSTADTGPTRQLAQGDDPTPGTSRGSTSDGNTNDPPPNVNSLLPGDADDPPDDPPTDIPGDTDTPSDVAEPKSLIDADTVEKVQQEAAELFDMTEEQRDLLNKARKTLFEKLKATYIRHKAYVLSRWETMHEGSRYNIKAACAIGVLLGLLLGLIAPNVSASVQTSLVGAVLMMFGTWGILVARGQEPGDVFPFALTELNLLLAVSLITHVGVALQWTIWRKSTDK